MSDLCVRVYAINWQCIPTQDPSCFMCNIPPPPRTCDLLNKLPLNRINYKLKGSEPPLAALPCGVNSLS